MDSSQRQKPQRAPGDKATVDRLFLLDLSDNRVVSLVVSKGGGTTTSGAVRPRPHSVVEQSTVFQRVSSRAAVSRSN